MADTPFSAANDSSKVSDAYGQAALLLVESLLHALIARAVINVEDAVEIVETAAEVQSEIDAELGDRPAMIGKSLAILGAISTSLRQDIRQYRPQFTLDI
jgi:hypothetical protein